MKVTKDDNSTKGTELSTEDIEYKIDIATQTLERNIGFVTNCDNKTSIVLATFGVLITIILTNEGLNAIFNIIRTCFETKSFCNIFYLICFTTAIFIMAVGFYNLGSVLFARTTEESIGRKDENSCIFFMGIRKIGNCKTYNQIFFEMNKEELLNDLIEQIYINADIAAVKYAKYNRGLKFTMVEFILFVIFLFIGIYIY